MSKFNQSQDKNFRTGIDRNGVLARMKEELKARDDDKADRDTELPEPKKSETRLRKNNRSRRSQ